MPAKNVRLAALWAACLVILLNTPTCSSVPLVREEQLNQVPSYAYPAQHVTVTGKRSGRHLITTNSNAPAKSEGELNQMPSFQHPTHHLQIVGRRPPYHDHPSGSHSYLVKRGIRRPQFVATPSQFTGLSRRPVYPNQVHIWINRANTRSLVDNFDPQLTRILNERTGQIKRDFITEAKDLYRMIMCSALSMNCKPGQSDHLRRISRIMDPLTANQWSKIGHEIHDKIDNWARSFVDERLDLAMNRLRLDTLASLLNQLNVEANDPSQPPGLRVWTSEKTNDFINRVMNDVDDQIHDVHVQEVSKLLDSLPSPLAHAIKPFLPDFSPRPSLTSYTQPLPQIEHEHGKSRILAHVPGGNKIRAKLHQFHARAQKTLYNKLAQSEWYTSEAIHDALLQVIHYSNSPTSYQPPQDMYQHYNDPHQFPEYPPKERVGFRMKLANKVLHGVGKVIGAENDQI